MRIFLFVYIYGCSCYSCGILYLILQECFLSFYHSKIIKMYFSFDKMFFLFLLVFSLFQQCSKQSNITHHYNFHLYWYQIILTPADTNMMKTVSYVTFRCWKSSEWSRWVKVKYISSFNQESNQKNKHVTQSRRFLRSVDSQSVSSFCIYLYSELWNSWSQTLMAV